VHFLCIEKCRTLRNHQPNIFMNKQNGRTDTLTTPINQPADKISKIRLETFLALIWGVFMQNFSTLAFKLREEFKVTDRRMTCCSPICARASGKIQQLVEDNFYIYNLFGPEHFDFELFWSTEEQLYWYVVWKITYVYYYCKRVR